MSETSIYARLCAVPYRPVSGIAEAQFVVRRFSPEGTVLSEIPLTSREVAEELLAKHQARGFSASLTERPV